MIRPRALHRRRGFTLIELLVVIGIILLLMTISVGVLRNAIGIARQRATETTILKIHGLMQQRIDAFNRAMERTNLQPNIAKMQRDWITTFNMAPPPPRALEVMVRKTIFQTRFPQNFMEVDPTNPTNPSRVTGQAGVTYVSANHNPGTESAALLYWILTNSEVYGVAPVDESEFSSSEVRDTDNDGLNEFVDGWGRPLRFFRWPTHLFRCGEDLNDNGTLDAGEDANGNGTLDGPGPGSPVIRLYASVLWSGLPAAPTVAGELDPLLRDPDDPTGALSRYVNSAIAVPGALVAIQNTFCTPNTYHAFLIVSAGPDGFLGLNEPYDPPNTPAVMLTSPGLGVPQGRLAALTQHGTIESHPINDNITNRKR